MHGEPALAAGRRLQLSSEGGHPFLHADQPNAGRRGGVRRRRSVVIDLDDESVGAVVDPYRRNRGGGGVPVDVGELFLDDPICGSVHSGRHTHLVSLDRQMCFQTSALCLAHQCREVVETRRRRLLVTERLQG